MMAAENVEGMAATMAEVPSKVLLEKAAWEDKAAQFVVVFCEVQDHEDHSFRAH